MKSNYKNNQPKHTLLVVLFLIIPFVSFAQNHSKKFEIEIENTKSGFRLKSNHGSRWLDLSFNSTKFRSQKIDEEGMLGSRENTIPNENEFADYLITFSKKNDKITLAGLKGTSWKKLSFTLPLNKTQKINEEGMVK